MTTIPFGRGVRASACGRRGQCAPDRVPRNVPVAGGATPGCGLLAWKALGYTRVVNYHGSEHDDPLGSMARNWT